MGKRVSYIHREVPTVSIKKAVGRLRRSCKEIFKLRAGMMAGEKGESAAGGSKGVTMQEPADWWACW
jgi:hypothetical protein